jgi:hypothetical protein
MSRWPMIHGQGGPPTAAFSNFKNFFSPEKGTQCGICLWPFRSRKQAQMPRRQIRQEAFQRTGLCQPLLPAESGFRGDEFLNRLERLKLQGHTEPLMNQLPGENVAVRRHVLGERDPLCTDTGSIVPPEQSPLFSFSQAFHAWLPSFCPSGTNAETKSDNPHGTVVGIANPWRLQKNWPPFFLRVPY